MTSKRRVLTTRPTRMAARLSEPLLAAGFEPINLPLFAIRPLPVTPAIKDALLNLDNYQKIFVLSPSAAEVFLDQAENYWPQWPVGIQWFTVGKGSHDILSQAGVFAHYPPPETGDTSEALLQLALLTCVKEEKILLVKGEGGRNLLFDELSQRGAQVDNLIIYQREAVELSSEQITSLLNPDYFARILTSGEALEAFNRITTHHLGSDNVKLATFKNKACILLPSQRLVDKAQQLGFPQAINTQGAGASALISSLQQLT